MAITQERIQVILEYIEKNKQALKDFGQQIQQAGGQAKQFAPQIAKISKQMDVAQLKADILKNKQSFFATWMDKLGVSGAQVQKILSSQGFTLDNYGNVVDLAGKKVNDLSSKMEMGRIQTQRFQMQWLSVLFFGMQIKRTFDGLIKTSLDWVGVNQLMTTTLGVFFLPIAEDLLNILLPIMEWFMNLPEGTQRAIGTLVVIGAAFGTILFTVGQLVLGLAGLTWVNATLGLGGIGTAAEGATSKVLGLKGILSSLVGLAIGITLSVVGINLTSEGLKTGNLLDQLLGILTTSGGFGLAGMSLGKMLGGVGGAALGLKIGLSVGLIVTAFQFINEAVKTGDLLKQIEGMILAGFGGVAGALALGFTGITAGALGFTIGVTIAVIWTFVSSQAQQAAAYDKLGQDTKKTTENAFKGISETRVTYPVTVTPSVTLDNSTINDLNNQLGKSFYVSPENLKLPSFNLSTWQSSQKSSISDAIIDPSGKIITTSPQDYLIATKNPNNLSGGNVSLSPVYNITVSDKKEFEAIIERNNRTLISETRRLVKL